MERIEELASCRPAGIILREKDLPEEEYRALAKAVLAVCQKQNTICILHQFVKTARELNCRFLHLPLPLLQTLSQEEKNAFSVIGASCHSLEEAVLAEKLGCAYVTAGHIWDTDCKKDLPGRGLEWLRHVCESVSIPVYAIGGIKAENIALARKAGAAGACVMSGPMTCPEPKNYLKSLEEI